MSGLALDRFQQINGRTVIVQSTSGGGSVGSSSCVVEVRTITQDEIDAKELKLAYTPIKATDVRFEIREAPAQFHDADYVVYSNTLGWSGLGLDGFIEAGDYVRIVYFKSPEAVNSIVEVRNITALEAAAKQLTLSYAPPKPKEVILEVIEGPPQFAEFDYRVTGNILSWRGRGLDGLLESGNAVRILYFM